MSEKTTPKTTTKKTVPRATAATAKKTAEKQEPVNETVKEPVQPEAEEVKKPTHLEDHVRIKMRSNNYGGLVFVNSRTRERIRWPEINDVQDVTVADIRDMRANSRSFVEEPWLIVEGVATPGYEMLTVDEIIDMLGLTRFYRNSARPERLADAVDWTVDEIKAQVPKMNKGTKENLTVALTDAIRDGKLNALDRIRAWEDELDCSLLEG